MRKKESGYKPRRDNKFIPSNFSIIITFFTFLDWVGWWGVDGGVSRDLTRKIACWHHTGLLLPTKHVFFTFVVVMMGTNLREGFNNPSHGKFPKKLTEKGVLPPPLNRRSVAKNGFLVCRKQRFSPIFNGFFPNGKGVPPSPLQRRVSVTRVIEPFP